MKVKEYDKDCLGNNQTSFINNADVYDNIKKEYLTATEVIELQLFIHPLDSTVFRFINGELIRNERYEYSSY